jgi:hypothetical protein
MGQWWDTYTPVLDPAYHALIKAEQTATKIQSFDIAGLHGLLQTEDYSRAITRSRLLPMSKVEFESLADLRLKRQWHVFEKAQPPVMQVVLDESVLHRRVGGAEVLREQLLHLARLAKVPHINIRILSLTRPIDYYGDFGLYSFVLLSDGIYRGLYREQAGSYFQSSTEYITDLRRYEILFAHLWQESLDEEESQALLQKLADILTQAV